MADCRRSSVHGNSIRRTAAIGPADRAPDAAGVPMTDTPCILALPLIREALGADPISMVRGALIRAGLLPRSEFDRNESGPITSWHLGMVLGTEARLVHDARMDLWYVELAAPTQAIAATAQTELQAVLPATPLVALCDEIDGGGADPGHYLALGLAARGGSGPATAILARALEQEDPAMLPFAIEAVALSGDRSLCAALSNILHRHNAPEIVRAVTLARTMLACPPEGGEDPA